MPTSLTVSGVAHLYNKPTLKFNAEQKASCRLRAWVSRKDRKSGEKVFTTIGGLVFGPQAEWLCRDGDKGTMVFFSGEGSIELFKPDNGETRASIEIDPYTLKVMVLDRSEQPQQQAAPAQGAPAVPPPPQDDGEVPF